MLNRVNEIVKLSIGVELFATFLIFLLCIFIYFKIKSFSNLISHKGIEYFQKGFLCFSISYLILFIEIICKIFKIALHFDYPLMFAFIGLFQLLGISYLLASMFSKQIKQWHIFLSIPTVMMVGVLIQTRVFVLIYSVILILLLGYISYLKLRENKSKKKLFSNIYIIYILIFLSWVIQVLSRVIIEIGIIAKFIQMISSILIFSYIFYIVYQKILKTHTLINDKGSKK